jgi:hypothetical protein
MKSQREVEKKYNELMQRVATDEYYKIDLTNRVNCYICSCGHITKTKDVDAGCTPMFHSCEKCGKSARSTFYKDIAPEKNPTQEWYRPSLSKVLKMRKNESLLDHILSGGLDCRNIES